MASTLRRAEKIIPDAHADHEITSFDVTPAVNGGFSVRAQMKQRRSKPGGGSENLAIVPYRDPETHAFSTVSDLVEWIAHEFGEGERGGTKEAASGAREPAEGDN